MGDTEVLSDEIDVHHSGDAVFSIGIVTVLVGVEGEIGFDAKLKLGLDASGLATGNRLIDGLYIDNQSTYVGVHAGIQIKAVGSVAGLFGVYGKAGIRGTIQAKPNDLQEVRPAPDLPLLATCGGGDGKTYLPELIEIEDEFGLEDAFKLTGSIDITGSFGIKALVWEYEITSGSYPIVKFGDTCSAKSIQDGRFVQISGANLQYLQIGDDSVVFEAIPTDDGGIDFLLTNGNDVLRDHRSAAEMANVRNLLISTNDGNDTILLDADLSSKFSFETFTINTDAGKDNIRIRQNANGSHLRYTSIDAGNGDDRIVATFADDTIVGGYGTDKIDAGDGNNVIYGDLREVVDAQGFIGLAADVLFGGNDIVKAGRGNDQIEGGFGNDFLDGGDGDNSIAGGWGADRIITGNGGGTIWGGYQDDRRHRTASFDRGDDSVVAGIGSYTIYVGRGDDEVTVMGTGPGAAVRPLIRGGDGNDSLRVTHGSAMIYGDAGDDLIESGDGDDYLDGGDGQDVIHDLLGTDVIDAGAGNDIVDAGDGNNYIYGRDGRDRLQAGDGNNFVYGGWGNDDIIVGTGTNYLFGRDDNRTLNPDPSEPIPSDHDRFVFGDGTNLVVGNSDADEIGILDGVIYRSHGNNTVWGDDRQPIDYEYDGDDQIYLGNGNNTAYGGIGHDKIVVGSGVNFVYGDYAVESLRDGHDTITNDVRSESNLQTIVGGGNLDEIETHSARVLITGGSGPDQIDAYSPKGDSKIFGDFDDLGGAFDSGDQITLALEQGVPNTGTAVTVFGGGGEDTFVSTGIRSLLIYGGPDDDTVTVSGADTANIFGDNFDTPDGGVDHITVDAKVANVSGNGGNDIININFVLDFDIHGGFGGDEINVTGPDNFLALIEAINPVRRVFGDVTSSESPNDGDDKVTVTSPLGTLVYGTGGNDQLVITTTFGGDSNVDGGSGNDLIAMIGGTRNSIRGQSGNDTISGTTGIETCMAATATMISARDPTAILCMVKPAMIRSSVQAATINSLAMKVVTTLTAKMEVI